MLVLTRKPNQSIRINDNISVKVLRVKGNTIQLGIEAPQSVPVVRSELLEKGKSTEPSAKDDVKQEKDSASDSENESLPPGSILKISTALNDLVAAI